MICHSKFDKVILRNTREKKDMEDKLFCTGGGCTAKLGPQVLERVLSRLKKPEQRDERLLVGFDSGDDAAVYRITEDLAILQTLDFFPPMVEDPYTFGQIAAANALSDIYAMGGRPHIALNIVCFPEEMDLNILGKIMEGGNSKVMEAGATLAGGHSIADDSVKYGLSVTGTVHPDRLYRNDTPRKGDVLLLTKPLGTGIICSAQRMGDCPEESFQRAVESMTTLNKKVGEALAEREVHAVTDVTGFGLACHLLEMVGEKFTAHIDSLSLPVLPHALSLAENFYITAAAQRNRNHGKGKVEFRKVPFAYEEVVFDPQTSGGLLVSLPREEAEKYLRESKDSTARIIGHIEDRKAGGSGVIIG